MKTFLIAGLMACSIVLTCLALEVDTDELSVETPEQIEFTNYTGPHTVINTLKEIQDIGRKLGTDRKAGLQTVRQGDKYTVIHAVAPEIKTGLDADIFILEKTAGVDHIRNLRMIIAGYLEAAYDYSFDDAFLLAEFITVYNAVYRFNMEYFTGRYKNIVMSYVVRERAGLSTLYSDWPGNTMMLIPLTEKALAGGLGALGTDELSGQEVVEKLREDPDKGIPSREKLIDLKEREVEEERKDIEKAKEELALLKKEGPTAPDESPTPDIPAGAVVTDKPADKPADTPAIEKPKAPGEEPPPVAAKPLPEPSKPAAPLGTVPEKPAEAPEDKPAAPQTPEEEKIAALEEEIKEREKAVEEREERIKEEREEIAEDKKIIIVEEETGEKIAALIPDPARQDTTPAAARPSGLRILFMRARSIAGALPLYAMNLIDEETGTIVAGSEAATLYQSKYHIINGDILVIASQAGAQSGDAATAVFWFLDGKTLAVKEKGTMGIFPFTSTAVTRGTILAVVRDGGSWKLGRFGLDLGFRSAFDDGIEPYTDIVVSGDRVYVQAANGNIVSYILD